MDRVCLWCLSKLVDLEVFFIVIILYLQILLMKFRQYWNHILLSPQRVLIHVCSEGCEQFCSGEGTK